MPPDSLSDQIVAAGFVIIGITLIATASCAFFSWRTRANDRAARRLKEMTQQFRAVTERLQSCDRLVPSQRKTPLA
jgi:uncharacterized membrane protein YdjX (TVP38/TMEM64 family)